MWLWWAPPDGPGREHGVHGGQHGALVLFWFWEWVAVWFVGVVWAWGVLPGGLGRGLDGHGGLHGALVLSWGVW